MHSHADTATFRSAFEAHVRHDPFPCIGARSADRRGRCSYGLYARLGSACSARQLCADLAAFVDEFPDPGVSATSFVAMFDDVVRSEAEFELRLWSHLQQVHREDRRTFGWDARVSSDPQSPRFSFSVAGRAFFVVGMSPVASRLARRAPMPCLVFNLHEQFEALKACGRYESYRRVIRERDVALQGALNPMLDDHGNASEARQYSGAATGDDWQCPFMREDDDAPRAS
jgi:FPC/CPF motif-containing protein YcgG